MKSINHINYEKGEVVGQCIYLNEAETVISSGQKRRAAKFLCKCGEEFIANIYSVKRNSTTSCGCVRVRSTIERLTTHGGRYSIEYDTWIKLRDRCNNAHNKSYKDYGGRGIIVCERWNNSFEEFIKDMGLRPSNKHSIDRIDNNLGYSKENCRWATKKEQSRNRRSNIYFTFNGETKTLVEWSESVSIDYRILLSRLKVYKWTVEQAFTTPIKREKRYLYFRHK